MDARQQDRRPHVDDGRHPSVLGRSSFVLLAALILGLAAIALTIYRLVASPGETGDSLGNILTSAAMVFASAGFVAAALRSVGDARRSWSWLAAGGIIYLLGELTWAVEAAVAPEPDGNSLADIFWLAALLPLFIGLLIRARESTPISARGEGLLDSLIVIGLFGVLVGRFVLVGLFEPDVPVSETVVGLAYPTVDAALLWMLLRGIYRTNSRWDTEQGLLAVGLLALLAGDILWASGPRTGATYSDFAYTVPASRWAGPGSSLRGRRRATPCPSS